VRRAAPEGFPRAARLRKRSEFLRVQQRGKKVVAGPLVGLALPSGASTARLGVTVSSKVGNAVIRARVRRHLREFFRRHRAGLPPLDLVVIARSEASRASGAELRAAFAALLSSLDRNFA
jgi:ribonuclease P protein component